METTTTPTQTPDTVYASKGFYTRNEDGTYTWRCGKCDGQGYTPAYGFNANGLCFQCNGKGSSTRHTEAHVRAIWNGQQLRAAAKEKARLASLAKRQAAWDKLAAEHPAVWELVSKAADVASFAEQRESVITERDSFVLSLADQLWQLDKRPYSERQIDALNGVLARRLEKAAKAADPNSPEVPEGRLTITGEVINTKVSEGMYGTSFKMLVQDDRGFRVYGSIPSSMLEQYTLEEFKGVRVTFTAQVERSRDDKGFGFFKRPTKGTVHS